jgi:hypothetical protein
METTYRRRQPASRLERLLARLLLGHPRHRHSEARVDLVHGEDIELRQA